MGAQNFRLNRKFDALISLDSVLTYLTKKNDFEKAIKNSVIHMKTGSVFFFEVAFTEKLIPKGFTDHYFKTVKKKGFVLKKEFFMKRKGNLLMTVVSIFGNDKLIIEEEHIHRILSERKIVKLLNELGCEVKTFGNSKKHGYHSLEVLAKKR